MSKGLSISLIPLAMHRMHGVKTVASGAVNRNIPQDEYVQTCRRYQQQGVAGKNSMPLVVDALWRTEGFSTTFGKYPLPENTLNDARIPRESWGITHVGYGAACTEHFLFDTDKLRENTETKSFPGCQGFTYEGMGSILRIYEPGIFKFMCGTLGLIPKHAPPGPDKTGFFAKFMSAFSPETQRLITHGYGRLVGFSKISVYKAIEEAMTLPAARVQPCVQGIAFAFAMMNAPEMPRLLNNCDIDSPAPVRSAFQNGFVYGMAFCDWFAPGFLAAWKTQGKLEEKLIDLARAESALNLKRGRPLAFALENSIGGTAQMMAGA